MSENEKLRALLQEAVALADDAADGFRRAGLPDQSVKASEFGERARAALAATDRAGNK